VVQEQLLPEERSEVGTPELERLIHTLGADRHGARAMTDNFRS
jgi:hypothetical protein